MLPLSPGSRIGVFAPSGNYEPARLEAGMVLLRRWGFQPVHAPHLGQQERYLAGTDAQRLADLEWALGDRDLQAAWMARGGYGLTRLLPLVHWERLRARPWFGFSDATALHVALWRRGLAGGVHGPVLQSLSDHADEATRLATRRLLRLGGGGRWQGRVLVPGQAEGPLVGGNLCTLASLAGSPEAPTFRGAIVLLEDVGEPPYRLDRYLTQILQAGVLDGVAAVVLGTFINGQAPAGHGTVEQALLESLRPLAIPVLADIPIGHGPRNLPFVYGSPASVRDGGLQWGR